MSTSLPLHQFWWSSESLQKSGLVAEKSSNYFVLDQFSSVLGSWTASLVAFWKAEPMKNSGENTELGSWRFGKGRGWDIFSSVLLCPYINSAVSSDSDTHFISMQVVSASRWIKYMTFIHIIWNFCSKIWRREPFLAFRAWVSWRFDPSIFHKREGKKACSLFWLLHSHYAKGMLQVSVFMLFHWFLNFHEAKSAALAALPTQLVLRDPSCVFRVLTPVKQPL